MINTDFRTNREIQLSPNQFIDHDKKSGFLYSDPEPFEFLKIEKYENFDYQFESDYPEIEIIMKLSDIERVYERESYTLMMMIGDIGGFNGAIVIIPWLFMGYYS